MWMSTPVSLDSHKWVGLVAIQMCEELPMVSKLKASWGSWGFYLVATQVTSLSSDFRVSMQKCLSNIIPIYYMFNKSQVLKTSGTFSWPLIIWGMQCHLCHLCHLSCWEWNTKPDRSSQITELANPLAPLLRTSLTNSRALHVSTPTDKASHFNHLFLKILLCYKNISIYVRHVKQCRCELFNLLCIATEILVHL